MRNRAYLDGKHFRARAEECRTIAELFLNSDTRGKMLKVAADYEEMAIRADEREGDVGDLNERVSDPEVSKL